MVCLKLQFAIFILCFQSTIAMDLPLSLETYKNIHAIIELATINSSQIHKGGLISESIFNLCPILKKSAKSPKYCKKLMDNMKVSVVEFQVREYKIR